MKSLGQQVATLFPPLGAAVAPSLEMPRFVSRVVVKEIVKAFLPGGAVLVVAAIVLARTPPETVTDLSNTYGLVVFGAGLALAWVFHRSRVFIALAILAWVSIAVAGRPNQPDLVLSLGTAVVLMLGALGIIRDRGVLSHVGALQALSVASGAALWGTYMASPERAARYAAPVASSAEAGWLLGAYPWPTLLILFLALCGIGYGYWRYRGPIERSFVWTAVLVMAAMHPQMTEPGAVLFLMGAGLVLTLGVVETSYVLAYQDELTGLPGRRALIEYLEGLQGRYALAMVDVDHFKSFNDRHGHDVGDQVLRLVAGHLARVPGGGRAYRYGGEEFALLFPGRSREDVIPFLETVRANVEEAEFSLRSWKRPRTLKNGASKASDPTAKQLRVTVSLGAAGTEGRDPLEIILKRADQALYRAKKNGRNRVSR